MISTSPQFLFLTCVVNVCCAYTNEHACHRCPNLLFNQWRSGSNRSNVANEVTLSAGCGEHTEAFWLRSPTGLGLHWLFALSRSNITFQFSVLYGHMYLGLLLLFHHHSLLLWGPGQLKSWGEVYFHAQCDNRIIPDGGTFSGGCRLQMMPTGRESVAPCAIAGDMKNTSSKSNMHFT